MRTRLFDAMALCAVLAVGSGLVALALSSPRILSLLGLELMAGGTVVALGLVLWARPRLSGGKEGGGKRDGALLAQIETLEGKIRAQSQQMREMAITDDLTGVLNRKAFITRLDELIRRDSRLGRSLALLLIDVEGFREINGRLGRVAGDGVLKRVSRALQSATRGTDCIGRLENDEFAVALAECDDPGPAVGRLFLALEEPTGSAKDGCPVRVAVGAVLAGSQSHRLEIGQLFRSAEEALRSVRGQGVSRCATRVIEPVSSQADSSVPAAASAASGRIALRRE